tara:strand:+ start:288 stop:530 length:243 start_codon:yes stop_codon:yes gene_type:complete
MQKIINVLAIASTVVSVAVVSGGAYVYLNKDSIIETIKEKAIEGIGGGAIGGALTGDIGLPSSSMPAGEAAAVGGTSIKF